LVPLVVTTPVAATVIQQATMTSSAGVVLVPTVGMVLPRIAVDV
jgi:hypothetical protein